MRKTARPVVWEGAGAQSPSPDPIFGGIGFGRWNRLPHLGGGGGAGCLIRFQLAEAAVDGALDAGFVAGEFGEGVGTLAIDVESAGREVALVGRDGWRRRRFAVLFGVVFFGGVPVLAALFLGGHVVEAVAVDAGLHGEDTVRGGTGRRRCAGPGSLRWRLRAGSGPSGRRGGKGTLRDPRRGGYVCWHAGRGEGDYGWKRLCLRRCAGRWISWRSRGWR